jgi:sialate O-acetylesterase
MFQCVGLFLTLLFVSALPAKANVKVNALFGDNAVLQRRKPIAVWGTAEPDEVIVVKLQNTCTNTTADKSGNWKVSLPAFEAGGPYALTVKGKNRLVFHNVYVGEVWLCLGQSNMEIPVSYSKHTKEDIDNSTNPDLHLLMLKDNLSATAVDDFDSNWQLAGPKTILDFSAVAYYFGRALQRDAHMPVGIVCAAHFGTPIKVWMSPQAIEASHDLTQVDPPANFMAIRTEYDKKMEEWRVAVREAREKGLEEPVKPVLPSDFYANSSAFNGMINPLVPFTARGVVWYQGESDYDAPEKWRANFGYMIDDFRKRWHDPTLPFVYVQIPPTGKKLKKPEESHWAQLRESQFLARRIPYAYMTCTVDIGRANDITLHPREKKEIGERLEQVALGCVYQKSVPFSGPLYDTMAIEGNKIKIDFRFAEGGLKSSDGAALTGFTIAGVDKKFVPAEAKISGNSVIVWSKDVALPVAVRYGWAANPDGNLCNRVELPASPFRTDKWLAHFTKSQIDL